MVPTIWPRPERTIRYYWSRERGVVWEEISLDSMTPDKQVQMAVDWGAEYLKKYAQDIQPERDKRLLLLEERIP